MTQKFRATYFFSSCEQTKALIGDTQQSVQCIALHELCVMECMFESIYFQLSSGYIAVHVHVSVNCLLLSELIAN